MLVSRRSIRTRATTLLLSGPACAAERVQMRLSARQLKGTIKAMRKGQTTADVQIGVNGVLIIASITNDAVDDLKLAVCRSAFAGTRASEVALEG